jgi:hypothetical protein
MATYVAIFALVLAYAAFVAAYLALRTLAKLRRASTVLAKGARGPQGQASLLEATQHNTERAEIIAEELADLRGLVADSLKNRPDATAKPGAASPAPVPGPGGLSHLALVRYDAFAEMSGRLSFSLALLDKHGDGVTISAIAGGTDTRVYAKSVTNGKGEHELSPEEQQAVAAALAKRGRGLKKSA